MKLYATVKSERGKQIGKGGNDRISIILTIDNDTRKIFSILELKAETEREGTIYSLHKDGKKIQAMFIPKKA